MSISAKYTYKLSAIYHFLNSKKVYSIIDQAIISGSTFVISYILALKFEKYEFGIFAFLINISSYFYTFHSSLVTQPYQVALNSDNKFQLIKTGNLLTFIFIAAFSAIFISYSIFIEESFDILLALNFLIYCSLYSFHEFFRRILQSDLDFKFLIFPDFIAYACKALLIFFLVTFHDLKDIQSIFLISNGLYFVSILLILNRTGNLFNKGNINLGSLLNEGKWLTSNSLIYFFSSQVYTLILAAYVGVEAVGVFVAILLPLGLIRPLFMSAESYLVAKISLIDRNLQFNSYLKEASFFFFPIFFVLIVILVSPSFFLNLIYAGKFQEYTFEFTLGILFIILNTSISFISYFYRIRLNTKKIFKANIYSMILTVPWGWWVTINYGVYGVMLVKIINSFLILFILIGIPLKNTSSLRFSKS
jgi:O-antigen/teichoic acid export membrane protein